MRVIRLRGYKDYFEDGSGWATYDHVDKKRVFVALIIGDEPKKIESEAQIFDVEQAILKIADSIIQARKEKEKASKPKAKLKVKTTKTKKSPQVKKKMI